MCKDCECKPNKCFPCVEECKVRISTDCATVPVELPNIGSDQDENLTTVLELIDEFLAQIPPTPEISITNVGEGEELFKGQSNLGNYEFRTLSAGSDLITVEQVGDDIILDVNLPELPQRTYTSSNIGLGAGVYKDSTITSDNTQFNFKTLNSTTLSLTVGENTISIDTPETAMVPALYVNNQYVPSYSEFLAGNTKGLGTFAKPFTDTVNYTNPTTPVQTSNTAIQNALDAYVGTGSRLNPQLSGQRIIIQNNNNSYNFTGDFNYSNIDLIIEGYVNTTTQSYIINMDNSSFFNNNSSTATITVDEGTLVVNGLGFLNSGNNISTNTLLTGRKLIINTLGEGSIFAPYNGSEILTRYLFSADPNGNINGTTGANNDGNLCMIINANVNCPSQGILRMGGKSRIQTRERNIVSGSVLSQINANIKAIDIVGGDLAVFGTKFFMYGDLRINAFNFQSLNGFVPTFNASSPSFEGYSNVWFNKSDNSSVVFSVIGATTQYFSGLQLFNSLNLWSINFRDNIFQTITIDFTKVDLTQGNLISSINTIGSNVIESLVRYLNRTVAQSALPPYSAFINTKDNPVNNFSTSAAWIRDITLPTT